MSLLRAFTKIMLVATAWFLSFGVQFANATPQHLNGTCRYIHTYSAEIPNEIFLNKPLDSSAPIVKSVGLTGGQYLYIAPIHVAKYDDYVLDFKNTSTIGLFRHQVFDDQNRLVASLKSGIESTVENPFF